jgi:hypothetical protein
MSEKLPKQLEVVQRLSRSTYEHEQLRRDLREQARRECEPLRVYEPLPYQEEFHSSTTQQVLVQKGNRTGASLALLVELARALTGTDPHNKYPKTDGKAVIVVYGENHVGRVVFNGLFKAGHFKGFRLIKDLATSKWRTYRPWPAAEGGDLEREDESVPHGPLIPKRCIEGSPAWVKKNERVFSLIRFTSGWELYAANSAGDPGQFQGMSINFYAIDEDLATSGWYEEALGRISDVGGLLRWTAVPHARNDEMMQLIELAEKEVGKPKPLAKVIRASILDNRFLDKEKRDGIVQSWRSMGEDVYRKRVMGDISISSVLMYPTFNRRTHDVMNVPTLAEDQVALQENKGIAPAGWDARRILAARMGNPPDDWTRYVSIDPGYNVCAIAFLTVPPPELGEQVFVYDLCYLHEANSHSFGEAMAERCADGVYESFIMDFHGGKLRSIASGDVPIEKYREALQKRNVQSERTGFGFYPGCDDRKLREEAMRTVLAAQRESGLPKLMLVVGKCQSLAYEIEKFRKKTVRQRGKDIPIDEGDRRAGTHAIEAVEQAIANNLTYVRPRRKSVNHSWLDDALTWGQKQEERFNRGQRLLNGGGYVSLGPNGANV